MSPLDGRSDRPRCLSQTSDRPDLSQSHPYNQHLYRYNGCDKTWHPLHLQSLCRSSSRLTESVSKFQKFQVITWNIDFSSSHIQRRTTAILNYIQHHAKVPSASDEGIPTIILLQEVCSEAFPPILSHPFLQKYYDLTDISRQKFKEHYGTVTLVPQSLTPFLGGVVRIPFRNTRMGRDALIIDLDLPHLPSFRHSYPSQPITSRIRICNTHLESLRGQSDIARPQQLKFISELLSSAGGGIVAGDMNAIAPTDDQVPQRVGLVDCWEVLHPQSEGHTWGYQPPSRRFPTGRLDKVLFSGDLAPVSMERIGMGEHFDHRWDTVWLSDHYGLLAQFTTI